MKTDLPEKFNSLIKIDPKVLEKVNTITALLAKPEYKKEIAVTTFHQSNFANNNFGVDCNYTPGRMFRQAIMERDGKLRALQEAQYNLAKKHLDNKTYYNRIKKSEQQIKDCKNDLDIELKQIQIDKLELEMSKTQADVLLSEKLVKDAINDAGFYDNKVKQILNDYYDNDIKNIDFEADEINYWTLWYKDIIESELRGAGFIGTGHQRSLKHLPIAIRQELFQFWRDVCIELQIPYKGPKIDFTTLTHLAVIDKVNKQLPQLTTNTLMIVLLKRNEQERVATDFGKLIIPKGLQFDINKHLVVMQNLPRADARNNAIKLMLDADGAICNWLLYVDNDNLLPKNYLLQLFNDKLKSKVRTGMYYMKTEPNIPAIDDRVLGAGGLLVHRDVFTKMTYPWFTENDNRQTDDVLFTEKLKLHKIDVDVLTSTIMGHMDFTNDKIFPKTLNLQEYCTYNKKPVQTKLRLMQVKSEFYKYLNRIAGAKSYIEIGCAEGGSLALACQVLADDALIIAIDLKIPDGIKSYARANQKIYAISLDSSKVISTVQDILKTHNLKKIDALFIDGDHSYNGVKSDFETYKIFVKNTGIIAFHDINPLPNISQYQVNKFWRELKKTGITFEEYVEDTNQLFYGLGVMFLNKEVPKVEKIVDLTILENYEFIDSMVYNYKDKIFYGEKKKIDTVEDTYLKKGERKLYRYVLSRPEDSEIGSKCCKDLVSPVGVSVGKVRHMIMPNDLKDPVGLGRNACVHEALNTGADYIYSADDDTHPPDNNVMISLIKKMDTMKLDALGAQYFRKDGSNQGVPIIIKGNNGNGVRTSLDDKNKGIKEVYTLPMGCTMIRASVFRKMADKQKKEGKEVCWFKKTDNMTEDSYFSQLAREENVKLWIDTDIICTHENRETGISY